VVGTDNRCGYDVRNEVIMTELREVLVNDVSGEAKGDCTGDCKGVEVARVCTINEDPSLGG